MGIQEIWATNVLIMPPRLVHLTRMKSSTSPFAGFVLNFDTSACCGDCNNISENLENCVALELKQHRYLRTGIIAVFLIGFYVTLTLALHRLWFCSQLPFAQPSCSSGKAMESPTSSVSTSSSSGESFAHNMWNHLLELLFHVQISGVFVPFVVETNLAKISLSCHFALDLLCYKESDW